MYCLHSKKKKEERRIQFCLRRWFVSVWLSVCLYACLPVQRPEFSVMTFVLSSVWFGCTSMFSLNNSAQRLLRHRNEKFAFVTAITDTGDSPSGNCCCCCLLLSLFMHFINIKVPNSSDEPLLQITCPAHFTQSFCGGTVYNEDHFRKLN